MSSPILPIQDPLGSQASSSRTQASGSDGATFRSELHASERSLAIADDHDMPPREVLEEIAAASRTNEELRASGYRVCFTDDERTGRTAIELRGSEGRMQRALSITEALDLAAGKSLS